MNLRIITLILAFVSPSISLAIDVPSWHDSDREKKEIGHQFSDPLLNEKVGYLPKIQTEEEYRDFIFSEQQKYESPLLNLANIPYYILSDLDAPTSDLKKTANDLAILNQNQAFELKFILTNERPSKFNQNLPESIDKKIAIIILNPNQLSNQSQISYSTSILKKLDKNTIRTLKNSANDLSIKHTSIDKKVGAVAKHVAIELRTILSSKIPTLPIKTDPIAATPLPHSTPPTKAGDPSSQYPNQPLITGNSQKTETEIPISQAPEAVKSKISRLKKIGLPMLGLIILLTLSITLFLLKRKIAGSQRDIEAIKEKHSIIHNPSFGATRGSYITEAVNFSTQLPPNAHSSKNNRGKVL